MHNQSVSVDSFLCRYLVSEPEKNNLSLEPAMKYSLPEHSHAQPLQLYRRRLSAATYHTAVSNSLVATCDMTEHEGPKTS